MPYSERTIFAPRRTRIRRLRLGGLLVALAVLAAVLGHQGADAPRSHPQAVPTLHVRHSTHRAPQGSLGEAGGSVPDGTTVFDGEVPGVARLDPDLLGALRRAANDGGVPLRVDSGWRSPAYQAQLLREAIAKYGSYEEAARWVATPKRSAHVSGDAVDLESAGAAWLSAHGAAYGLCRIYANEPWHFELRPDAVTHGCPPMYSDPTQDPRMRQ